jgi:hypothetical protein
MLFRAYRSYADGYNFRLGSAGLNGIMQPLEKKMAGKRSLLEAQRLTISIALVEYPGAGGSWVVN